MNKYITLLFLGVLAAAMAMVLFFHLNSTPKVNVTEQPAQQTENENTGSQSTEQNSNNTGAATAPAGEDSAANEQTAANAQAGAGGTSATAGTASSNAATAGQTAGSSTSSAAGTDSAAAGATSGNTNASSAAGSGAAAGAGQTTASSTSQGASAAGSTAPATASVAEGKGTIKSLGFHFKDKGMVLRIEGNGPLPAKYFILSKPERLVVDLPGSWQGLKAPNVPSNNLVESVRIGRHGNADRLVLDLRTALKNHSITRLSDNSVEVYFD